MRLLALVVLCGCSFEHAGVPASTSDDATTDTVKLDAPPFDAPSVDATSCAAAPSGCSAFSCAGSSSCYYVCGSANTGQRSWFGARDACASLSLGCLVTISSQAEHECIVSHTNPVYPDNVWIGLRQTMNGSEPSGGWGWDCGISTYSAWALNEPNDANGGEDCGILATGGDFNDATCYRDARFVCELSQ